MASTRARFMASLLLRTTQLEKVIPGREPVQCAEHCDVTCGQRQWHFKPASERRKPWRLKRRTQRERGATAFWPAVATPAYEISSGETEAGCRCNRQQPTA